MAAETTVIRLRTEALKILQQYNQLPSEAIFEMERQLKRSKDLRDMDSVVEDACYRALERFRMN